MEWRPIETVPKIIGNSILGFGNGDAIHRCAYIMFKTKGEWRCAYSNRALRPTHWQPLPAPPKDTAWIDRAAAHDFNDES